MIWRPELSVSLPRSKHFRRRRPGRCAGTMARPHSRVRATGRQRVWLGATEPMRRSKAPALATGVRHPAAALVASCAGVCRQGRRGAAGKRAQARCDRRSESRSAPRRSVRRKPPVVAHVAESDGRTERVAIHPGGDQAHALAVAVSARCGRAAARDPPAGTAPAPAARHANLRCLSSASRPMKPPGFPRRR